MIKLIFASGENGEFGTPTGMPWPRHKQDMQEFKRLTKDNLVVMGNETFKTLPDIFNMCNGGFDGVFR